MKKQTLNFFLRLIVSVGLLVLLVFKIDVKHFLNLLEDARIEFVLVTIGIIFISRLLLYWRLKILLDTKGIITRYWEMLRINWICDFAGFFVPGLLANDALRAMGLRHYLTNTESAFSSVIIDRFIGTFSLISVTLVSIIMCRSTFYNQSLFYITISGIAMCVVCAIFLIVAPEQARVISTLFFGKIKYFSKIDSILKSVLDFSGHKRVLLVHVTVSLIIQILRVLVIYASALALNVDIAVRYYFLFVPITFIVVMIPVSIGGFGVKEGAFVFFFSMIGIEDATSFAISVLSSVLTVLVAAPGGLIYLKEGIIQHSKR